MLRVEISILDNLPFEEGVGVMREKKRIPNFFSYRDCDDFANYLNRQAKKGWHFREFRLGLVFEKGEPRDTFYRVEVFPKGSEDDLKGNRDTEEYADYCREAGWKFVDSVRKFCVFERIRANAVPIVTDEERLENVKKAERVILKRLWFLWCIIAFRDFLEWFTPLGNHFPAYTYFNPLSFLSLMLVTVIGLEALLKTVYQMVWEAGHRKKLQSGEGLVLGGKGGRILLYLQYVVLFLILCMIAWPLVRVDTSLDGTETALLWGVLAMVAVFYTAAAVLAWLRPADGLFAQLAATPIIFIAVLVVGVFVMLFTWDGTYPEKMSDPDLLPLTQADYSEPEGEVTDADYEMMGNVLGSLEHGTITYTSEVENTLEYDIYRSDISRILDQIQEDEKNRYWWQYRQESDLWDAEEEVAAPEEDGSGVHYVARYDDALLVLYVTEPLSGEQAQKIRQTLDLGVD